MYNNRIFYSCDYLNILNRYLTDIGYNVDYANISESLHSEMNNSLDILKLLPLIGVTSYPLTRYGLSSIQINDRYYTSMTVYDIRKILKMENDQEIINQVKMIAYNYPSQFFEDNSNPKYSKFRMNTSKIYKDSRDDVLFLDDLQRFDFELASSLDENVFSENANHLYRLVVRFHIPYFLLDIIKGMQNNELTVVTQKPLVVNGSLKYVNYDNDESKNSMVNKIMELQNSLYKSTKDENILAFNTIYECYIVISVAELNNLVKLYTYEKNIDIASISMMYFCLKDFQFINKKLSDGLDIRDLMHNLYRDNL